MEDSILSDASSDPFASPSTTPKHPRSKSVSSNHAALQEPTEPKTPSANPPPPPAPTRFDAEQAREAALRKELDGVRAINAVIESVTSTLDRARGNMSTVHHTVTNASTLLNTWTRMLSQTEHNQRLILNPDWKGATADVAEMEAEERARREDAERRAREEEKRREEVRRKAEEEEMRKAAAAAASSVVRTGSVRGTSGRGRVRGRGTGSGYGRGAYSSGYGQSSTDNTTSSIGSGRGGSGIGRGLGSGRARGRGAR